jgi:hypothetical protein
MCEMAFFPSRAFFDEHLCDFCIGEEIIDVPMEFLLCTKMTPDSLVKSIERGTDVPVPISLEMHHPLFSNLYRRSYWEFDDEKIRPLHENRNVEMFL